MAARIYKPTKNAMQSGKAGTKAWVIEFVPATASRPDTLMGWIGSTDTSRQVKLSFDDKDAAIAFARAHGIPHQVIEPRAPKLQIRSYSDNFAFRRREPWSH